MSGGAYDYFFVKLELFIDSVSHNRQTMTPSRKKLLKKLKELSTVVKAIEWEDSGDTSKEETEALITKFLTKRKPPKS